MSEAKVTIVGAGINGLVAANYLQRAGCKVTMIEQAPRPGGACVSEIARVGGIEQPYALGASVLGLMQDFVFNETGLAGRLQTFVPDEAKLVHFPGDTDPTRIFRDPAELDRELANRWGERGDVQAFRDDEARVVRFLQDGYINAAPPSIDDANEVLGQELASLWISGSARALLDHYFTSERAKIYMAMTVTESGPVSLNEPYSAFTLPMMDSGSVFGGSYGFVKGGLWRITEELAGMNSSLGVDLHLSATVAEVREARLVTDRGESFDFDFLVLATDPLTASRLVGDDQQQREIKGQRFLGSSGKLNLMFRKPVKWKHGDSNAAFRFLFAVDTLDEFEKSTLAVAEEGTDYVPGYAQIYCEGAAMRQLDHTEPFDRLAVFFKNLALGDTGDQLEAVEEEIKSTVLEQIENKEDCVWSRLLTPKDLQQLFHFPGGNLDHTMLVGGQTFFDRTYAAVPSDDFYRFGDLENVYLCGSGTYPCGSVAGTPGYMCSQQLLRQIDSGD